MAIKWEEKPVDQTGAKTKNHYIAFLELLFFFHTTLMLLLAMSAFRGTQFFLSFSQAYIMKAVADGELACTNTNAYTQTHILTCKMMMIFEIV